MLNDLNDEELLQYHKLLRSVKTLPLGNRRALVLEHGVDSKYAYHVVRLLDEVEQILTEGDIDLQRNREQLKSIRRGEWTLEDIQEHFARKERELETLYTQSKLPHSPDEAKIKQLLVDCLEMHYGNLSDAVVTVDAAGQALRDIRAILDRVR